MKTAHIPTPQIIDSGERLREFVKAQNGYAILTAPVAFQGRIPIRCHIEYVFGSRLVATGPITMDQAPANDPHWQIFEASPGQIRGTWNGASAVRAEWWGARPSAEGEADPGPEQSDRNLHAFRCAIFSGLWDGHPETEDKGTAPQVIKLDGQWYYVSGELSSYHPGLPSVMFRLVGRGRQTFLHASKNFQGEAVVRMGGHKKDRWKNSFGGGVSGVTIWANGKVGIECDDVGENSRFENLRVTRYGSRAINMPSPLVTGVSLESINLDTWQPSDMPDDDIALDINGHSVAVSSLSINGSSSNLRMRKALVRLSGENVSIRGAHLENGPGILIDGTGAYTLDGIDYREGTTAVIINTETASVSCRGIWRDRLKTEACLIDHQTVIALNGSPAGRNHAIVTSYDRGRTKRDVYWSTTKDQ